MLLLLICACTNIQAQMNIINTISGNGFGGFSGDNGPAINAKLYAPEMLCLDKYGNIYITDVDNNRIREINISTGIITTIAGNGTAAYYGDNGPATDAMLYNPEAVMTDTSGNIYIGDGWNYRVRKINCVTGVITTIAGTGIAGNTGDGGPATNAQISRATGLCFDKFGNLYIADWLNHNIRKVDALTSVITTFAGTTGGYSGDNGPATNAQIQASSVFADSLNNVYLADQGNHVIRRVDAVTGIITTIAGTGVAGYSGDNGPATHAQLNQPRGIYVDKHKNIFIADYQSGTVRKIDPLTSIITTVAGTGTLGYSGDNGPATNAQLQCTDVFLDDTGSILIAEGANCVIRKVYYCPGNPVASFTDTGTHIIGYTYTGTTRLMDSVRWNFGDGGTSTLLNPVHIYTANGTYHSCVTAYTYCGSDSACHDFIICVTPPLASFTDTGTHTIGYTYTGTTTLMDSVRWYFGDGGTSALMNPIHTFTASGTYHVCVTVYTSCGSDSACSDKVVLGVPFVSLVNVKIYPNPGNDELHITGVLQKTGYRLLTVTSICIQQGVLDQGNNTLSIKNFAPGIYILEMTGQDGVRNIMRVIKE